MADGPDNPAIQRRTLMIHIAITVPVALAVWFALRLLLPPIPGMDDPLPRVLFGLGCVAVAVLLALVPGVEAIAHERLASPAIDPLAGYETHRLRVNQQYLQNTLEQTVIFAAGLLLLCWFMRDGGSMRAVVAVTAVWILARWAFWIGYHESPLLRAWGAMGMLQSMIVLLYAVYRFGNSVLGPIGGIAPLVIFFGIEAFLFTVTRKPPRDARR